MTLLVRSGAASDFISRTAVFSDFFLYLFYSMFLRLYSLSAAYFIPVF